MTYFINHTPLADVFRICFYGTVTDTVRRLCSLQRFDTCSSLLFRSIFFLRTRPLCTMGTNKLLKTNLWFQNARSLSASKKTKGEMFLHTTGGTVFWTIACLREELAVNRIGTGPGLCLDRCRTKRVRITFIFCLLVGVSKLLTGSGSGYLGRLPTLDVNQTFRKFLKLLFSVSAL